MSHYDVFKKALGQFGHEGLSEHLKGESAALRRWRPGRTPDLRATAYALSLGGHLLGDSRDKLLTALHIAAQLASQHQGEARTGEALHKADVSEARLNRLLTARDGQLLGELMRVTGTIRAKGVAIDARPLALLALTDEPSKVEELRMKLATSYYRTQHSANKED